jgi:outer membrane protein TolC
MAADAISRLSRGGEGRRPARRQAVAVILLVLLQVAAALEAAAQAPIPNVKELSRDPEWFPRLYKSYLPRRLPDPQLTNSPILSAVLDSGKLRLSISDLRTAVRENNLTLLYSSFVAAYAETDLLRAKGGGAPRGASGIQIPSGLFAGAIGAGLGGAGGLGGFGSAGGISGGARQVTARPQGNLDPTLLMNFSVDSTVSPLSTVRVSGIPVVGTHTTALQARYVQAFTTGTSISITFNNQRQSSTQQYLRFNPLFVSSFNFTITQQLLNGFGRAANERFMEVARNDQMIARELVRAQTSTVLAQALTNYWDVAAARENVRVAEMSLEVARRLYEDNKVRQELGKMSRLDVITAEAEVAARRRDLVVARTNLQMREADLKNILSKQMDAGLAAAEIETVDPLPEPRDSDIPELGAALRAAMSDRPEIRQAEGNVLNQAVAVKYAENLLKPTLVVFGVLASAGLSGNSRAVDPVTGATIVIPGGITQAVRQVRGFDFPDYAFGFSFSVPLNNSSARADSVRARLEQRQDEVALQQTRNRIALEVRKAVIGLVQAKAQVEAARQAVGLAEQSLAAEETRLLSGMSTAYNVIQRQRDLRAARLAEVQARANYAKALVEMSRSTGALDR